MICFRFDFFSLPAEADFLKFGLSIVGSTSRGDFGRLLAPSYARFVVLSAGLFTPLDYLLDQVQVNGPHKIETCLFVPVLFSRPILYLFVPFCACPFLPFITRDSPRTRNWVSPRFRNSALEFLPFCAFLCLSFFAALNAFLPPLMPFCPFYACPFFPPFS